MGDRAFGLNGILEPEKPQPAAPQSRRTLSPLEWDNAISAVGMGTQRMLESQMPMPYAPPPLSEREPGVGPQGLAVDSQARPTGPEQVQHFHNAYEKYAGGVIQSLAELNRANAAAQSEPIENQPVASENKTKMLIDWQKNAMRNAYSDVIAGPAGNIAITPGVPLPVRILAGALYAPKLAGDIEHAILQKPEITPEVAAELKQNPRAGPQGLAIDSGKTVERGRAGNVFQKLVNEPIEEPARRFINDPGQFLSDIYHNPTKLWPDILLPGTMAHGVTKPGINAVKDVVKDTVNKKIDAADKVDIPITANKKSATEKSGALSLEQKLDNAVKSQDLDAMSNVAEDYAVQGNTGTAQGIRNYVDKQRSGETTIMAPDKRGKPYSSLSDSIDEGYTQRPKQLIAKTGIVDANDAELYRNLTGLSLDNYVHEVPAQQVHHALKGHIGETEIRRGQIPLTKDDFMQIPDVTKPENIVKVEKGSRGQPIIIYEKGINGHILTLEEVLTGRKALSFLSMRKTKRSSVRLMPDESDPVSHVQDAHSSTSTTNISPGNSSVNNHIFENNSTESSAGRVRQRSNELAASEEIIDVGELDQNTVQRIRDSLKDEKGSISPGKMGEALPHIYDLGKRVLAEGFTTAHHWYNRMKEYLGDMWGHFKDHMGDVWRTINKNQKPQKVITETRILGVEAKRGYETDINIVIDEGYKSRPAHKFVNTGFLSAVEVKIYNEKSKLDLSGYHHEIVSTQVRHVLNEHPEELEIKRGQIPITKNDFLKLPEIIKAENLTGVEQGRRGQELLIYEKPVNGHIYVVEEILKGKKALSFLSLRKYKRSSAQRLSENDHRLIRPERHSLTSDSSISPGKDAINNHILGSNSAESMAEQAQNTVQSIRDSLKDERGSISPGKMGEAFPHIYELGKKVLAEGFTTAHHWYNRMREYLGDMWGHFKGHMGDVWRTINNERGSVGLGGGLSKDEIVKKAVEDTFADKNLQVMISLGKPSKKAVDIAKKELNMDISNINHELSTKDIRHSLKTHGNPNVEPFRKTKEGVSHQTLTVEDLKRIGKILDDPDSVCWTYNPPPGSNNPGSLVWSKRVNGTIYYVETYYPKKDIFRTKTMWKTSSVDPNAQ